MRFAFYVSGGASRLVKVCEMFPEIIHDTYLVVNDSAPNEKLAGLLNGQKTEYIEFNYRQLKITGKARNEYISRILLENFQSKQIDYAFCFGGKILGGELLATFKNKIINFHPAILPVFPGEKAINQALDNRAFLMGNTAHFIDEGVDTGPVIMQSILHSNQFNDYEDVLELQLPMIRQIYQWLNEGRITINNRKVNIEKAEFARRTFYPALEK